MYSGGHREPWGMSAQGHGQFLEGGGKHCGHRLGQALNRSTKTAEPIEVPFWGARAPTNHVLGEGRDPPLEWALFFAGNISRPNIKYRRRVYRELYMYKNG